MWNPLSGMTKIAIAGTLAGGILVSGIAWQGDTAVDNTKLAIDSLKAKAITAMSDVEFLRSQFSGLKAEYDKNNAQANLTISQLKQQRLDLQTQLADKMAQWDARDQADATAKVEIQNEINRLESELDKANQKIAELEQYAKTQDQSVQYTAVNQADYQFSPVKIDSSRNWTVKTGVESAVNYTQANIDIMSDENNILAMEQAYKNMGRNITIVGITTHVYTDGKTYLAYIVQPDNSNLNQFTPEINNVIKAMSGTDVMFFINEQGTLVGSVFEQ